MIILFYFSWQEIDLCQFSFMLPPRNNFKTTTKTTTAHSLNKYDSFNVNRLACLLKNYSRIDDIMTWIF